jgi:uncharacterized protein YgiM (DUF1202 family)
MSCRVRALVSTCAAAALALAAPLHADAAEAPAKDAPAAPAATTTTGTAKMVLSAEVYDGGEVPKGTPVEHDFTVRNTGTADLLILSVKPACGCTTPGFDKVVPPGGTGKITLKVDTARFKGPISKTATVTTNDPDQPNVKLVMNANVQTFIDVLPRDSVFFRQYRGEAKKEEVTIKSNEPGAFTIKDVQVTGEGIKHELAAGTGSNEQKLSVWIDKSVPIGNVDGSIKLVTSSTKEPEVTISVRGTILGQINLNPSTLYFRVDTSAKELVASSDNLNVRERGELNAPVVAKVGKDERLKVLEEAGEWTKVSTPSGVTGWVFNKLVQAAPEASADQSKVINVTHRQDTAFKITGTTIEATTIPPDAMKVATEAVTEGQSYRITVTYAGKLAKGNYSGAVILKTSDKEEPEVKVPLYIVVS